MKYCAIQSVLLFLVSLGVSSPSPENWNAQRPLQIPNAKSRPPNIVFILTDDQDLRLDSLSYTPLTTKALGEKGTFYSNHFVTTALCCPSRVSLWTGKQAHNTNVTDVNPPYGKRGFKPCFDWAQIFLYFLC